MAATGAEAWGSAAAAEVKVVAAAREAAVEADVEAGWAAVG